MPRQIFISYRRDDEPGMATALYLQLEKAFSEEHLFMDVEGGIRPGHDFVHVLEQQVAQCDVMLALVGRSWLSSTDANGQRRLDNPEDFVRIEIESAMRLGKLIIPVLINKTEMPRAVELPDSLKPFARRHAVRITQERFRADGQGMVEAIGRALADAEQARAGEQLAKEAEEEARKIAAAEERRRSEEARRREGAERKRQAEEDERREVAEREAAAWARLPTPRTVVALRGFLVEFPKGANAKAAEAELTRLYHVAEAWETAKRADNVAAVEKFLTDHPDSPFVAEARELHAMLLAREAAYQNALASSDPEVLKAFISSYPKGMAADKVRSRLRAIEHDEARAQAMAIDDPAALRAFIESRPDAAADQVVARLRQLEPSKPWRPSRRALVIGGVAGAGGLGLIMATMRREPSTRSEPTINPPSSRSQAPRTLHVLSGHTDAVQRAVFSSDGNRILTASYDKTARLWDARIGAHVGTLVGHVGRVYSAKFSRDGERIITHAHDDSPQLWDSRTAALLAKFGTPRPDSLHFMTVSAEFNSDGSRIITTDSRETTPRLWDGKTGASLATLSGHAYVVAGLVWAQFSPDGSRIVTYAPDNAARLWDGRSGAAVATLASPRRPGGLDALESLSASFSPDGSRIVTYAAWEKVARLWDGKTGAVVATLSGHSSPLTWAWFSPDGSRLVTLGKDESARIWNGRSGAALATFGLFGAWASATFSPDGSRIVTRGDGQNTARVWDGKTGAALVTLSGHTNTVYSTYFSPDGSRIVTRSGDNTAKLWNIQDGTLLATIANSAKQDSVEVDGFSPDGGRFLTRSTNAAGLWDTKNGRALATLSGHTGKVNSAAFSPDASRVVTTSDDKTARLWDAAIHP